MRGNSECDLSGSALIDGRLVLNPPVFLVERRFGYFGIQGENKAGGGVIV